MNENAPKKPLFSKKIRVIALILAVLLVGEIILSNTVAVNFSSQKYADSEYEQPAEYIEQNDEYLTAGTLSRMRAVVSLLGEPKTYDQFSLFASVAIADEEYAKATDYLLQAVELYPGDDKGLAAVYIKIGCLRALDEKWKDAASLFEKAIALDETNPSAHLMQCETYLKLGDHEKALSALETYASLTEPSAEEFDALIQLQIEQGKLNDALAACDRAEKNGPPEGTNITLYRAQLLYLQGDTEKALAEAERCRQEGADPVRACALIALCSEETGDYQKAVSACQELIDEGTADLAIYQQAAQDAYLLSDYPAVIRFSEEALQKFGDSADTLVFKKWLGIAYFQTNEPEKAEKNLTAMIESGDPMPELNYLRGICEMGSEKYEEAIADFTASLSSEELMDDALYNRALCYIRLDDTDSAALDFQEVIDRNKAPETIGLICDLLGITPEQLEQSRSEG